MQACFTGLLASVIVCSTTFAQVTNPADAAKARDQETPLVNQEGEVPETVVLGRPVSALREEDRVGSYDQPVWTTHRLFPSTRVYVRPEGSIELEYWTRVKVPDEGKTEVETMYELELGLPGRFQLDLYAVTKKEGSEGELELSEQKYELRYALADWGEIWMNPTLYLEWVSRDAKPDKVEYKVLLGDELAEGWHFGTNLVFEHEISGDLENEYGLTMGVAHTIIDNKLSLGGEMKAALIDVHGDRGDYTKELEVGPSLRWQPRENIHVDFAPLVGIGSDSRAADIFLVIGVGF